MLNKVTRLCLRGPGGAAPQTRSKLGTVATLAKTWGRVKSKFAELSVFVCVCLFLAARQTGRKRQRTGAVQDASRDTERAELATAFGLRQSSGAFALNTSAYLLSSTAATI